MNHTSPGEGASSAPAAEAIHAQLLRYAEDMEQLMQQHHRLQKHHQMVLQSIGREIPTNDLLPTLLYESCPWALTTDAYGRVLHVSRFIADELEPRIGSLRGRPLLQSVTEGSQADLEAVLKKFSGSSHHGGAVHMPLVFQGRDGSDPVHCQALVMQASGGTLADIYWCLREHDDRLLHPIDIQAAFISNVTSDHGLMITDAYGTIRMVNPALSSISGFSESDLLGNNPRMFSSGRHDQQFYQDFWMQLLDVGSWSGTIFNRRKGGQIFLEWQSIKMVEDPQGKALSYLSAMVDLTHADNAPSPFKQMAYQDPLTGLANRRLLVETFSSALVVAGKGREELSVLFIDLDRFKPVNDELGHEVGDAVLKEVAERIKAALLPGDFLARVGGDEFVVLLRTTERAAMAEAVARDINARVRAPIHVPPHSVVVGASVGCARYPLDGTDMITLLTRADDAMYAAKRFNLQFSYFDSGQNRRTDPNLEFDIWHALERNELHLLYQPQVRAGGAGGLRGCEVLIRWDHPTRGAIGTPTFIPIAEKNGAIVGIGKWVIAQACHQLQQWLAQGLRDFVLSVNVSLRQLRDPGFAVFVQQVLHDTGVPPSSLELEFSETDTLLFRNDDQRHIKALRDLGVGMAIDDFGISFSSLSRLNSLSISGLKINSQFVQELSHSEDAKAISRCLVAIGEALDIDVIAQGVESADQALLLSSQGCQVIQGFYAGQPMAADELLAMALGR